MKPAKRWPFGFYLLFAILVIATVAGQVRYKPLRFLTTRDGLPQAFVSGMVQDKDGFIWLGTPDGLARYDGRQMKLFQHQGNDTTTLAGNAIFHLQVDQQNKIWIFYENYKVDCFDPVTEAVIHVPFYYTVPLNPAAQFHVATDDGSIWSNYGNGLYLSDTKRKRGFHFSAQSGQLPSDTILCILQDRQNRFWATSAKGICLYQPQTGRFKLFPFTVPFRFKPGQHSVTMHQRRNGELVVSDTGKLFFFNPATGRYRTVPLLHTATECVGHMQTGPDGTDYLETWKTLYRYDDRNGLVELLHLPQYTVWDPSSFLVDRSGLLWLGLNIDGVVQLDLAATAFNVYPNAVAFHRAALLQDFGEAIEPLLDQAFPEATAGVSSGRRTYLFRSVWGTRGQGFWGGFKNRVAHYNPANQQWQMLPPIPDDMSAGAGRPFDLRGLDIAEDGKLWVISEQSIRFFDPAGQQWNTYTLAMEKRAEQDLLYKCNTVKADAQTLWITSGNNLIQINIATRQIRVLNHQTKPGLLPDDQLLGMEADPTRPHLLWISSRAGLIYLNKKLLTSEIFTTRQGLPNNTIYAIQSDNNGFLWLSTNQGLCRFHPVTHQVKTFTVQNGLPGNEFNTLQYLKLKDGRLAFGGVDGWVAFDPATVKQDTFQPPVAFTGLKIYNEPVYYAPESKLLPQPLNQIKELVLPYDQNTLTFEFAGLEYSQPDNLHYRYRLDGYDDKWVTTDRPVASYTKLSAGHYRLQINCTNTSGQWSSYIQTLSVTIRPPWWRTNLAYAFYLLAFCGLGYAIYRAGLQRARARQQFILQQKEAEQLKALDEMKGRFFSNITHEFRTPLSLIMAPARQLQQENLLPQQQRQVVTIQQNAKQLLHIINQLLDMAKLEAASMKITHHKGNISQFVQHQVQPFLLAAAEKKISLRCYTADEQEEYLFDTDKMHSILSNLLSNAIKFTPSGGTIEVTVAHQTSQAAGHFSFTVQDSGIGIPADKLPFIFNRFYQVDDSRTRTYEGTGIGLALAKELTELMGGTLAVASQPNKGTVFTLAMTFANADDATVPAYERKLPEAVVALPVAADQPEQPSSSALVLIVEDNKELNEFIAQTFQRQYRVITALNGVEGLQKATEELPDLIISDLMMPQMDGIDFCKSIKTNAATNHIGFLLLTGKANTTSKIEGLQSGADDYLTKPFLVDELQLRVANMLHRQQQLRHYFQRQLLASTASQAILVPDTVPATHPFLEKLYAIIEAHLDDTDFSVEKLATKAAISERTLQRKLSTLIGLPPVEIIKQYRLKRAAEFLEQGMGVAETTYQVGYESPAYFSTLFKNTYGVAPSEYGKNKVKG